MAKDVVINGETHPDVEAIATRDTNGDIVMFYPDAVRYVDQPLTEDQKAQARKNIDALGTAQLDWNAKEGEPGHVKNRTHWVEAGETVEIVPETTHVLQNSDTTTLQTPFGITLGKTYIVNWNGVEYKCEPYTVLIGGVHKATALGDYSHFTTDFPATGEPFGIVEIDEETASADGFGGVRVFIHPKDADPSGRYEYTISIAEVSDIVHKLDPKFLPDGVPYIESGGKVELPIVGFWEDDSGGEGTDFLFYITAPVGLEIGKTYTVNWDGTDYEVVGLDAMEVSGEMPGVLLGNQVSVGGADTGEPFMMVELPAEVAAEMGVYGMVGASDRSKADFAIYGGGETVHKLDPMFLPDGVPYIEKNGVILEETEATSFTHPAFGKMWMISHAPKLSAGETYTVTYNGTPYKCVCQAAPAGLIADPDAVAMGNFSVVGGANTGELFAMLISYTYQEVDIIDLTGAASVRVEICGDIYHKLNNELLDLEWLPIVEDTIIVEETTVENGQPLDNVGFETYPVGTQLAVRIDGVRYPVTVTAFGSGVDEYFIIGDQSFATTPFFATLSAKQIWFYFADKQAHVVSIYTSKANKMPAEFLPEDRILELINTALGGIENGTY